MDNEEVEEETLGDARMKRPRLEEQWDWQHEEVASLYRPTKTQFPKNGGPIKSVHLKLSVCIFML
jgi:hypothetical protein